ncbi:MAG: hypothetical protein IKN73_03395, partial [Alphaproteobacteria bacterium]|nr:hypothetical protein [Alphaproteobacteria bacterium]
RSFEQKNQNTPATLRVPLPMGAELISSLLRVYRRIGCAVADSWGVAVLCRVFALGVQQRQRECFELRFELYEQLR